MHLATWLERTRGKAPWGGEAGETRTHCGTVCGTLACTVSLPGTQTEVPGGQAGRLGLAGVRKGIGAHDSTATLDSCRCPGGSWSSSSTTSHPRHMTMTAVPLPPRAGPERLTDRTSSSLRVAPFMFMSAMPSSHAGEHIADARPGAREHCAAHNAAFSPRARNGKPLERNEKKGGVGLAAATANQQGVAAADLHLGRGK